MKKVRVPLYGSPQKAVALDARATEGAVIGVNVWNRDGSLFVPGTVATPAPGNNVSVTLWRLVQEIPPNVSALERHSGTGLYAITGTGASATRAITSATLDVQHGDGVAGDPAIDLAPLPDTGGGTLQKLERDQYGRLAGTSEATTDDLPEGSNLYFTDERADARVDAGIAEHVAQPDPHPQYTTASEAAAAAPVQSVNGKQGAVTLGAGDVGAEPVVSAGSAAHFWRGDKEWSNELRGSMSIFGDLPSHRMYSPSGSVGYRFLATVSDAVDYGLGIDRWNGAEWIGMYAFQPSVMHSVADNSASCGISYARWSEVYSATGTINTSDAREKTAPRDLTEAELAAAADIARLPCIFQWLHAIEEKGEDARLHASPTVQAVIAAMEAHGLDPFRYGFVCFDQWDEQPEIIDEETGEVTQEYRPAGDRYSLRPTELAHFVLRGLAHRQDELERRLAALEAA